MPDITANKRGNDYYLQAGRDLYEDCPKAVWAAIAISLLSFGGDELPRARERILHEWMLLHQNGIVPQPPPKNLTRNVQ